MRNGKEKERKNEKKKIATHGRNDADKRWDFGDQNDKSPPASAPPKVS